MYIWCEIVCRECANTVAGLFTTGQIPKRQMKKEALQAGWKFKHYESFCCQDCLNRYERICNEYP